MQLMRKQKCQIVQTLETLRSEIKADIRKQHNVNVNNLVG